MSTLLQLARSSVNDASSLLHSSGSQYKMLAVLRAYMDESGIHAGSSVCAIAGVVGSESEWEILERRWRRVIAEEGISVFHMAQFESRLGEFGGWSNTRRQLFMKKLIEAIKARDVHCVGSALVRAHYDALSEDDKNWMTHGNPHYPYFLCFQHCIVEACHVADRLPAEEKVAFVFDRQQDFAAEATRLYNDLKDQEGWPNRERLADIVAFASKRETTPLQVADLIAYECYKHLDNKLFHQQHQARWPISQLGHKLSGNYFDATAFSKLLAQRQDAGGS
jgi:hypothetical protein